VGDPGAGTDELVTERLLLRPLRESDLAALAAIYADPAVMRFLGGPRSLEATRTRLGWIIAAHREQGFGLWATTLRADGTLVGRCGLIVQDVEGQIEHEIAYLLGSQWWGRGYATEAAAAIRDHARGTLGLDRLISLIDPENVASQAVALRIGMHHERDLIFEGRPTSLFGCRDGV
jgi:ribosomal-protein-alanine N-acetyltransferase